MEPSENMKNVFTLTNWKNQKILLESTVTSSHLSTKRRKVYFLQEDNRDDRSFCLTRSIYPFK